MLVCAIGNKSPLGEKESGPKQHVVTVHRLLVQIANVF